MAMNDRMLVTLYHTKTQRSASSLEDPPQEDNWPPWAWTDGEMQCDCNRRICFEVALGVRHPNDVESPCGDGEFLVTLEWNGKRYCESSACSAGRES